MKVKTFNKTTVFLIDDEDFTKVQSYSWFIDSKGHVIARKKLADTGAHKIRLHRLVMNVNSTSYPLVDHINGNKLDNRKQNLRLCDYQTNAFNKHHQKTNTSGYRGVDFHKKTNTWRSRVCFKGARYCLGYFKTAKEAGESSEKKRKELL